MFNKIGDSVLLKVSTIENGKTTDTKVATCPKCGMTLDQCHCFDEKLKSEEQKDEPKSAE